MIFIKDMRKLILFIAITVLILAAIFLIAKPKKQWIDMLWEKEKPNAYLKERITYDIMLGKFCLGTAVFNAQAPLELGGNTVNLMTFQTKIVRFTDLEKIYYDPRTFLPIKVERDIYIWPSRETITEEYDQENFVLNITKLKGKKEEKTLIKKEGFIHNAILLPYHVRQLGDMDFDWALTVRLPTQQFEIKLISKETITVPAGKFLAYHLKSIPKRFEIWITADSRRIPVKIKGSGVFGYTLVMRDYSL